MAQVVESEVVDHLQVSQPKRRGLESISWRGAGREGILEGCKC